MKQWFRLLLVFVLLAAATPGMGGMNGSAAAQSALIEDPVLEAAVREGLGIEDRELTEEDLLQLTSLYPQGEGIIKSLKGLELAENMQGLYLPGHEISDLKPLAGLTELTFLALDGNAIEDICPIKDLYLLSRLVVSNNNIQNIDCLSQLFSLTDLLAGDNRITDITALAHLPLRWLLLDNNRVTDLSPLERHRELEHISVTGNPLQGAGPLLTMNKLQYAGIDEDPLNKEIAYVMRSLKDKGVHVNDTEDEGETSGIPVYFDGKKLKLDAEPVIAEGSTLVPFRSLFEAFGLKVGWDDAEQKVSGTKEGIRLELQIGKESANVNGKSSKLAAAPKLIGDFTYVPLRFVGEALGYDVVWEHEEKAVYLYPSLRQVISPDEKGRFEASHTWKVYEHYNNFPLMLESDESRILYESDYKTEAEAVRISNLEDYYQALLKNIKSAGTTSGNKTEQFSEPREIGVNGLKGVEFTYLLTTQSATIQIIQTLLESEDSYYRFVLMASEDSYPEREAEYARILSSFRATKSTDELYAAKFGGMKAEDRIADAIAFYKDMGYFKNTKVDEADLGETAIERYTEELKGQEEDPFAPDSAYSRYTDLFMMSADSSRAWAEEMAAGIGKGKDAYVKVLKQWAAILRGAFNPTDITENWRSEDGPVSVDMIVNGKKRTLYPEQLNGYLDIGILEGINAIIADTGYRFEVMVVDEMVFVTVLTEPERKKLKEERMLIFDELD